MHIVNVTLIAAAQLWSAVAYAADGKRDSWYIGLSLMTAGKLELTDKESEKDVSVVGSESDEDDDEEAESSTSPPEPTSRSGLRAQVGGTLNSHLLLGLDLSSFKETYVLSDQDLDSTDPQTTYGVELSQTMALSGLHLTFFPFSRGLYFGLGIYRAVLTFEAELKVNDIAFLHLETQREGTAAAASLGYALWLGKTFNLSVDGVYSEQKFPAADLAPALDGKLWMVGLGFYWY